MIEFNNLLKIVFLVFISSIYTLTASAATEYTPKPVGSKAQALQEKRLLFEQEAAAAIPEVETEYAKFITYINSHQTPDDSNVLAGLKFIAKTRKFLPVFNKQQKSDFYYTLSAWVYYFDSKPDKALKQVVSGYKLTPQNSKIAKTYLALSLIYRDYTPIADILASQEISPSVDEPGILQDSPYQQPSAVELDLDINKIHSELLGKLFDTPIKTPDQNSSLPGKKIMCLLLWKLDPNELERFSSVNEAALPAAPNSPPVPEPNMESQPPTGEEESLETTATQIYEPQKETPSEKPALEAFSQLQNSFAKDVKVVFRGINFNDPAKAKNIENWLAKNPQPWKNTPLSAELQQKITSFLAAAPDKQTLLIIGPDSTARYIGDVNNFLPQMIISNILGNPQEFAEPNKPGEPNLPPLLPQTPAVVEPNNKLPTPPESKPAEIQQPPVVKETNETPALIQETPPPAPSKTDIDEDFFDPRAETLIENARAFFKIGNRLQYHTYAKPVEMCRTVIKDYPNTKYSEQARILMRQVPERFRERYSITDEELGL
jgi:hypothetical protein